VANYKEIARDTRLKVLDLIYENQTSHIGSNFSVIDMAVVLYENLKKEDVVIWSAGWKAATACVLEGKPFTAMLDTGSCGHGLPIAVGRALARKREGKKGTVYCIMSEGELNEGTTWESAMFASHHKLDNLVVLVDVNGLQAMGKTKDIMEMDSIRDKWKSFGWHDIWSGGHDYGRLNITISYSNIKVDKPNIIICATVKGKGVKEWENNNQFHYQQLTKKMYESAIHQLTN